MAQAQEQQASMEFTDLPVGEILKRTRLHYQQSIQDVEYNLRIRAEQVEAIENNDVEKLPAKVYAIGFVRSYSEYLGLDGDKMVELFKKQTGTQKIEPQIHIPVVPSDHKLPPLWLVGVSIVFIVVMMVSWSSSWDDSRKELEAIPEVPESIQKAVMHEPVEKSIEKAVTEKSATEGKTAQKGIILNIRKNSWVEIRDQNGKRILSRVLKAGDQYFVPDRPDLTMSLGNAGGVEIEVDGHPLKPLGKDAQVRRNISLDAGYLKSNYAQDE